MMNVLNVVFTILMDILLSASVSVHNGALVMKWTLDRKRYEKFHDDMAKDPIAFRICVQDSLKEMDFDVISQQAREAVTHQMTEKKLSNKRKQDQEECHEGVEPDNGHSSCSSSSSSSYYLEYGEEQVYEMAFKLLLILFYWFSLNSEVNMLGQAVSQRFVKPLSSCDCPTQQQREPTIRHIKKLED